MTGASGGRAVRRAAVCSGGACGARGHRGRVISQWAGLGWASLLSVESELPSCPLSQHSTDREGGKGWQGGLGCRSVAWS